jgi:hypothetical protein
MKSVSLLLMAKVDTLFALNRAVVINLSLPRLPPSFFGISSREMCLTNFCGVGKFLTPPLVTNYGKMPGSTSSSFIY